MLGPGSPKDRLFFSFADCGQKKKNEKIRYNYTALYHRQRATHCSYRVEESFWDTKQSFSPQTANWPLTAIHKYRSPGWCRLVPGSWWCSLLDVGCHFFSARIIFSVESTLLTMCIIEIKLMWCSENSKISGYTCICVWYIYNHTQSKKAECNGSHGGCSVGRVSYDIDWLYIDV